MRFSNKPLPIFLLALLISPAPFCFGLDREAEVGTTKLFADLASYRILDDAALAEIDGGDTHFNVDRFNNVMEVKTFNLSMLTSGGFDEIEGYTVPITTSVIRNSEVSDSLKKDAYVNKKRAVDGDPFPYYPTQITAGTYYLDYAQTNVASCGPGIHIDTNIYTVKEKKPNEFPLKTYYDLEGFMANDFFVHATGFQNTNGCVGVLEGMDKVMDSYNNSGGLKTITISPNTNTDMTFLTSNSDYTAATDKKETPKAAKIASIKNKKEEILGGASVSAPKSAANTQTPSVAAAAKPAESKPAAAKPAAAKPAESKPAAAKPAAAKPAESKPAAAKPAAAKPAESKPAAAKPAVAKPVEPRPAAQASKPAITISSNTPPLTRAVRGIVGFFKSLFRK